MAGGLRTVAADPYPEMPFYRDRDYLDIGAEAVIHSLLDQDEEYSYEQLIDFAIANMLLDEFAKASTLLEIAVRVAPSHEERVFATMWLGQAYLDHSTVTESTFDANRLAHRAGNAFNVASELAPESSEAAAMRVIAWKQAGDNLEVMAAEHDLRRLGVDLEGEQVALVTGTAILAWTFAGLAATYVVYLLQSDLTEEEKLDRLEGIMKLNAAAMWASKPKILESVDVEY
tara:strand:+ start:9048 stop:9737 length:690 start_codon:yes stop_codon:yes gene_type:complete